MLKGGINHSL